MLGIKIGDKHTWRDWGLRLESYTIPMPEPQTKTIEVPGMSSVLDLT
ncbi:MAG: mtfA protein, partial [Ruminococcaceae bacterium]|nr:mtfA protein [Oscillospiraceae bacterium]